MICRHEPDLLGWLPSGSWGCTRCGWVAPITAVRPDFRPWWKRKPDALALLIGLCAILLGIGLVFAILKWIG